MILSISSVINQFLQLRIVFTIPVPYHVSRLWLPDVAAAVAAVAAAAAGGGGGHLVDSVWSGRVEAAAAAAAAAAARILAAGRSRAEVAAG